jgi:uncharacterized protein YjbJ (UPF0337 family)
VKYEDEIKGKGKQVKGTMKEKVGRFTGNRRLEDEGAGDRAAGKVQETFGRARRRVGEAVEDAGKKIAHKG